MRATLLSLCLALGVLGLASWAAGLPRFSLYITKEERKLLMGIYKELYYVREGVVNEYALGYTVTALAPVTELKFKWNSVNDKPVLYEFRIQVNDKDAAMYSPTLSIPERGRVPDFEETFTIGLPCTFRKTAEVNLLIQINVTTHQRKDNYTLINLHRKKVCLYDERAAQLPPPPPPQQHPNAIGVSSGSAGVPGADSAAGGGGGSSWGGAVLLEAAEGLYATSGVIVAVCILSVGLVIGLCRRRSSSKMRPQECQYTSYASAYGSPPSVLVSKPPLPGMSPTRTGHHHHHHHHLGNNGSDSDCGSYATIASFHKVGLLGSRGPSTLGLLPAGGSTLGSRAASPYATSVVATGTTTGNGSVVTRLYSPSPPTESAYSSYSSYCPRRVAYYAASSVNSFGKPTVIPQVDARLREPLNRVRLLSVSRHDLETHSLLYEGAFGRVYRGLLRSRLGGHQEEVLVKTVSDQASELQVSVLLSEGLYLAGLTHEHIVAPKAVFVEAGERPLIAYPLNSKQGNLKRFLINSRNGGEGHFTILTKDMVHMAMQVALGVAFLHTHRIWHKDVAARNCVVDSELRVRIADAGLSRDLFPADYHCLGDSDNRPIGWLAPESLALRHFSAASDVWAWGVFLWELVTLAGQPYQEVDPFEMSVFLRDGYRLAQPSSCPDELFGLMAACWVTAPEDRPSMTQLLAGLQEFSATLGNYI